MVTDPDLAKLRALCARLEHPHWMPAPQSWVWRRPDGMTEGFGMVHALDPGLANLLWLAMDMAAPPAIYSIVTNPLMLRVLGYAPELAGTPLRDLAALRTLQQFHDLLPAAPPPQADPLEQAYPLLKLLADRRLRHV